MRIYTVTFSAGVIPATNSLDLFEITPASNKPVAFLGADAGDAQEELLGITVVRGHITSGSGGSAPTPVPLNPNSAAAGFTAETLNTTLASGGTAAVVAAFGWNIRVPLREFWPQELWPVASAANTTMVVRLATGGADTITANGTLYVAELA
jgi:hypothetical protein